MLVAARAEGGNKEEAGERREGDGDRGGNHRVDAAGGVGRIDQKERAEEQGYGSGGGEYAMGVEPGARTRKKGFETEGEEGDGHEGRAAEVDRVGEEG